MADTARPNILMLCAERGLATTVLFCVRGAGHRPVVAGTPAMRALRFSRYCREFIDLDLFSFGDDIPGFAERVNEICQAHAIDLVMPGDYDSQNMLCRARDRLDAALFPMPTAEQFAELNDKWRFQTLCERLAIPFPKGIPHAGKAEIDLARLESELGYPMVVKPTQLGQSEGLVLAPDAETLRREVLDNDAYPNGPLVVQTDVGGVDIGLTIFAAEGEVVRYSVHLRDGHEVVYVSNAAFLDATRRIARELTLNGVYDFDAMLSDDGESVHLLECNARFWGTMAHAQWCGANFVETGIAAATGQPLPVHHDIGGCSVQSALNLLVEIVKLRKAPWRLTGPEKFALRQGLGDPVALVLRAFD